MKQAIVRWLRRWVLLQDARNPKLPTDLPESLKRFTVGEALPWKGTLFKVGKVIGGDFPCIILVPASRTRGEKLRVLRVYRDVARAARAERKSVARSLKAKAS